MATIHANGSAPPPPPDAQAQVNGIVNDDEAKGRVAVHTFDPESSPQDKAAAAGKGSDQLNNIKTDDAAAGRGTKRYVAYATYMFMLGFPALS